MSQQSKGEVPRRVLLIEDNASDRALIRSLLTGEGAPPTEVYEAASTKEAMALLADQPIDAIFLDLGLPEADHVSALSKVLSMQIAPPVIVLTGSDETGLGEASIKIGAEDFLPKDVLTAERADLLLDRVLRYCITRHRQRLILERESAELRWLTVRQRTFISRITNDLQGPVTAMHGLVSTLNERHRSLKAAERRHLLEKLSGNAHALGLKLTRLIADAEPVMEIPNSRRLVAMADVVPAAINAVGERPPGTHVSLQGDLPKVWGHREALQRSVSELVRNAVVHAPAGHAPTIRVEVRAHGTGIRLTVTDDGVAIPIARRASVFEPGVKLDQLSIRGGLGLTQVRATVAEHGGSVWIDTSETGGTAVTMTIPQRETGRGEED